MSRDLGDFQTPPALVAAVLDELGPIGRRWPRVLEPTCGRGHFLAGLLSRNEPPREVIGIEIQDDHATAARATALARAEGAPRVDVAIIRASLFDLDLRRDLAWRQRGPLLVIGNPPWVTSAALGVLASGNLPPKWNVKGARGLDARTGAANFDIAEAIWLKLIDELAGAENDDPATIALLCKMSVARNVLEHAERRALPIARASLTRIDARRWFGAEVEACVFRLVLEPGPAARLERVPVFAALGAAAPASEIGFARGRLVADLPEFQRWTFADGVCPLTWRQGLKHDAAAVMELMLDHDGDPSAVRNKQGDVVDVEPAFLYPLLKGADLARPVPEPNAESDEGRHHAPRDGTLARPVPEPNAESESEPARRRRAVIVTQTRIGEDTRALEQTAPRLWAYLLAHAAALARRKSSIYRGQPPFAMFGIGPYSFSLYKVAVSGLHKTPRFRAIGPVAGRPVMLDDTCYFLACSTPEQAALVAAILDEEAALGLLRCLTFAGAKRPVTKAVLQRLDLAAIAIRAERAALLARANATYRRLLGPDANRAAPLAWPAAFERVAAFILQGSDTTDEDTSWPLPPSTTTAAR